jgi:hypothetical protein
VLRTLDRKLPAEKIHTVESAGDALNLLRTLGAQKRKKNVLRERRAHLMAERLDFKPDAADESQGTLLLSGNQNDLVFNPVLWIRILLSCIRIRSENADPDP